MTTVALGALLGTANLRAEGLLRTPFQQEGPRFEEFSLELGKHRLLEVEIINNRPSNINWENVPSLRRDGPVEVENCAVSEALDELFSEAALQRWFRPEQWLALHQGFLSQMDFNELIHLSKLLDYMEIWPETDDDFYIRYFKCQELVNNLDSATKRKVLLTSYQTIAERLREMSHRRRRWGAQVSQFFHQDSNVHQMPSGEPLVSTTAGLSSESEVSLNYTTKDYSFGQTQVEAGVIGVNYFDSELEERNFQTYRLGLEQQFLLSGPFALGGVSLDLRSDILNLNKVKEETSRSVLPSFSLISRPKKFKKGAFLDSIVSAGGV